MRCPIYLCLKECPAHIYIQSSVRLSLLTSTCSVVCLLPQIYSNKILYAALVAKQFHAVLCLVAQRKGMVIYMRKFISWNNKRRTWSYWIAIELLLFTGLNISWWLDSSNSTIKLIYTAIMMSFNLHTVQLFIRSIFPIHLTVMLIIACVNHIVGIIPNIKRIKLFGLYQFYLKSAFLSDLMVGILLEEIALEGLRKLSETFRSTSIALWVYCGIFILGSLLYWKHVFPVIQYLKPMWHLLNGRDYEKNTWYNVTNSNLRFSTFDRVPNKGKITAIIVDRFDLECINFFTDTPVKDVHFLYYLICIDRSKEISTDFIQTVKKIVNLPHAKTLVYLWGNSNYEGGSKELADYLSKSKNVRIHDFGRNKYNRSTDMEEILSEAEIKARNNICIPFRTINNEDLMRTYFAIGNGSKLCLDFMKTILNNLDTLPAIYALFDYIDLQYRIVISYITDIDYNWMKNNSRSVGNFLQMGGFVEEEFLKPNYSHGNIHISLEEIFQNIITTDELSLVHKYLPSYEIDNNRPAYETTIYLTASLRNVLRGHGMLEISDANSLFSLVFKLALLNVYILNVNSISMHVDREKVWDEKDFYSVIGTNSKGVSKNMSPFFVAEQNGNILVFNNWVMLTTKDNKRELTANPNMSTSTIIGKSSDAIEYINYLDGSLIMPEFRNITIEGI